MKYFVCFQKFRTNPPVFYELTSLPITKTKQKLLKNDQTPIKSYCIALAYVHRSKRDRLGTQP